MLIPVGKDEKGNPEVSFRASLGDMAYNNVRTRATMLQLAYAAAAANGQTGRTLSDKDLAFHLQMVGFGATQDAQTAKDNILGFVDTLVRQTDNVIQGTISLNNIQAGRYDLGDQMFTSILAGYWQPPVVDGAPDFTNGWTAAGIASVTDSTSSTSTTTGALVVSGGVGIAKSLYVGEGVSVAGTITYDDVTNIDSVGLITARTGIKIGPSAGVAATIYTDGAMSTVGIITASQLHAVNNASVGIVSCSTGADLNGYKVEEGKYDTDALNGEFDFLLENGHIQTHTGSTAGTFFPDFKVSSGTSLNSVMDVGDVISCTLFVAASNTAHYCTTGIKIDDSTSNLTIEWIGSAAPTAGKGAGFDVYAFTIQKTATTPAYLIIVNATDAG